MHWPRARRRIPTAVSHVVVLSARFRHHFDPRPNPVAITFCSLELELDPVMLARTLIHPDFRWSTERAHHHIQLPIAIQIPKSRASMPRRSQAREPSLAGQSRKLHSTHIAKHSVGLADRQ